MIEFGWLSIEIDFLKPVSWLPGLNYTERENSRKGLDTFATVCEGVESMKACL